MSRDNDTLDIEYEVDKIIKMRVNPKNNKREFLVKWQNWKEEDSTWEPEKHLENVQDLIDEFLANQIQQQCGSMSGIENGLKASKDEETTNQVEKLPEYKELTNNSSLNCKDDNNYNNNSKMDMSSSTPFPSVAVVASLATDQKPRKRGRPRKIKPENEDASNQKPKQKTLLQPKLSSSQTKKAQQINSHELLSDDPLVFEAISGIRQNNSKGTEFLVKFQNSSSALWVNEIDLKEFDAEIQEFLDKHTKNQFAQGIIRTNSQNEGDASQGNNGKISKQMNEKNQRLKEAEYSGLSSNYESKTKDSSALEEQDNSDKDIRSQIKQSKLIMSSDTKESKGKRYEEKSLEELRNILQDKSSQSLSIRQQKQHKFARRTSNKNFSNIPGDFKSDNVDRIELLGDPRELMSCRVEVTWKQRSDQITPSPGIFSTSYLRREYPALLIDHLAMILSNYSQS